MFFCSFFEKTSKLSNFNLKFRALTLLVDKNDQGLKSSPRPPFSFAQTFAQKLKSRFRITTNGGQCISCGNCSTYCEMGIDVRAYAQKGQNIVRSSCVGCGVCSSVCPRGVLKLENAPELERIKENPPN